MPEFLKVLPRPAMRARTTIWDGTHLTVFSLFSMCDDDTAAPRVHTCMYAPISLLRHASAYKTDHGGRTRGQRELTQP